MTRHLWTDADDGRLAELARGDEAELVLDDIGTSGFQWKVEPFDEAVLRAGGSELAIGAGAGAGGRRTFHFAGIGAGGTTLRLKLWRPWEGDASIRKRFSIDVLVR